MVITPPWTPAIHISRDRSQTARLDWSQEGGRAARGPDLTFKFAKSSRQPNDHGKALAHPIIGWCYIIKLNTLRIALVHASYWSDIDLGRRRKTVKRMKGDKQLGVSRSFWDFFASFARTIEFVLETTSECCSIFRSSFFYVSLAALSLYNWNSIQEGEPWQWQLKDDVSPLEHSQTTDLKW